MSRRIRPDYTSSQIKSAFKVVQDTSGSQSGRIHVDTLVEYLTLYGSNKLTEERARQLVGQVESDAQGFVNYEECVDMMMHW